MAENYLTAVMDVWQQMLKDCPTLLALLDDDADRVHRHALPPIPDGKRTYSLEDLIELRPFAIAMRDTHKLHTDSVDGMGQRGRLLALLEWPIADEDALKTGELYDAADEILGGIAADLETMNGQPTRLRLLSIEIEGPWRCDPAERKSSGDHFRGHLIVDWGFGG